MNTRIVYIVLSLAVLTPNTSLGFGKVKSKPSWLELEWSDRYGQTMLKRVELELVSNGFKAVEPIRVKAPITGAAWIHAELRKTQLPSLDMSDLSCDFITLDEGRTLSTWLLPPFLSPALKMNGRTGRMNFEIARLEDSVNQIHPGKKFDVRVRLENLEIQVPVWIE